VSKSVTGTPREHGTNPRNRSVSNCVDVASILISEPDEKRGEFLFGPVHQLRRQKSNGLLHGVPSVACGIGDPEKDEQCLADLEHLDAVEATNALPDVGTAQCRHAIDLHP
jgi:hypothetical protein